MNGEHERCDRSDKRGLALTGPLVFARRSSPSNATVQHGDRPPDEQGVDGVEPDVVEMEQPREPLRPARVKPMA